MPIMLKETLMIYSHRFLRKGINGYSRCTLIMVELIVLLLLALLQGCLEWLPVSSKGIEIIILTQSGVSGSEAYAIALFLHLGTVLATLLYFRKEWSIILNYKLLIERLETPSAPKKIPAPAKGQKKAKKAPKPPELSAGAKQQSLDWKLIIIASICTGIVGLPLYFAVAKPLGDNAFPGSIVSIIIGFFMIATGIFIIMTKKKEAGTKMQANMSTRDIIIMGLVQGLSVIPGVSRSGTTVSTLLAEGVNDRESLRISYIVSVPVIIAGNIFIALYELYKTNFSVFTTIPWYGLLLGTIISFVVGYFTIGLFLRLAQRVNFGYFCILFGSIAVVIMMIVVLA
jgi:undecaprenyl-diphosphatase